VQTEARSMNTSRYFPHELKSKVTEPWTKKDLPHPRDKDIILSKHGHPDVNHGISILSSRVKESTEVDWKKLLCVMNILKKSRDDFLTFEADYSQELNDMWIQPTNSILT